MSWRRVRAILLLLVTKLRLKPTSGEADLRYWNPRPLVRPRLSRGCTANSTRSYTVRPGKHGYRMPPYLIERSVSRTDLLKVLGATAVGAVVGVANHGYLYERK